MPGKEDTYHWALVSGPKVDGDGTAGIRYHAKEDMQRPPPYSWTFTEEATSTTKAHHLLVRILIARIKDLGALQAILRTIPVRAGQPEHAGWNCIGWVKEALKTVQAHSRRDKVLGRGAVLDWTTVRDAAMDYIGKKRAQSRWGADAHKQFNLEVAPTYDLLEQREVST